MASAGRTVGMSRPASVSSCMGVVLAEGALRGGGLRWLEDEWRAILR